MADLAARRFAEAVKNGEDALRSFAEGKGLTGGLDVGAASRLALNKDIARQYEQLTQGFLDTFIAAGMNEQGQMGGVMGGFSDWWRGTIEGAKWLTALLGAFAGGRTDYAYETADMAISRSAAGAQAYMTTEQINAIANQAERLRKTQREQNT